MEKESSTDEVTIQALTRFTWEKAADLELHPYQEDFLPSNLHSMAQARFENLTPMGIFSGNEMVGFLMYGNFGGVCWINRIMVDKNHQEKGYGRKALRLLLRHLRSLPTCREIRTSFVRANALAEYFFGSMGFFQKGKAVDGEIVMQYLAPGQD